MFTSRNCGRFNRVWLLLLIVMLISSVFGIVGVRCVKADTSEIRAVWLHMEGVFSADPEQGKIQAIDFVNRMAEAGINLILPWVRSEYMAAIADENYQKSVLIANWDALGVLIKAAHEKGLEVHPWYSFTYYKTPGSPEFNPKHKGDPRWAARQLDELTPDKATGKISHRAMRNVCPLHSGAREWELRLLQSIFDRYSLLTGIHIEEPGYSGKGNCVCDLCLTIFRSIYGAEETGAGKVNSPEAEDLRCLGTTAFMRQLHAWAKARNPRLFLSTNGAFHWRCDRRRGRDWLHWADLGWLDFYAPQVYTDDMDVFRSHVKATIYDLRERCPVAVGIAVQWGATKKINSVETILKQIETARQLGAKGFVFFPGEALTPECLSALKGGPFKEPSALPATCK